MVEFYVLLVPSGIVNVPIWAVGLDRPNKISKHYVVLYLLLPWVYGTPAVLPEDKPSGISFCKAVVSFNNGGSF